MTTATAPRQIEIRLNGRPTSVPEASTLSGLLLSLGKDPRTVAIERNGDIVRRASFETTTLSSGDSLEIVQFVQGG